MDNTYEVIKETVLDDGYDVISESCFVGSLTDCNAWIQLRTVGYI